MDTKNFTTDQHFVWQGWLERVLDYERERMRGWTDRQIIELLHENASLGVSLEEVAEFYDKYPYPVHQPVEYHKPKPYKVAAVYTDEMKFERRLAGKKYNRANREKIGNSADLVLA